MATPAPAPAPAVATFICPDHGPVRVKGVEANEVRCRAVPPYTTPLFYLGQVLFPNTQANITVSQVVRLAGYSAGNLTLARDVCAAAG